LAYPHPIGYDVVNYYIPVVSQFHENWQSISDEFPLYTLILYSIATVTNFGIPAVVSATAVAVFGLFAFSTYYLSRNSLRLGIWESAFISGFVIVQLAVLRTTWDLHRDVFALSIMFLIFGLISRRKNSITALVVVAALSCLAIASDRMIGLLLAVSLVTGAIIKRKRDLTLLATVSSVLFISLLIPVTMISNNSETTNGRVTAALPEISALDYLVLFAVLNGTIAIPAILGFIQRRNILLAVPFIISGIGSLSWIVLPDPSNFVPERWMILFGVFASIYAGNFFVNLTGRYRNRAVVGAAILAGFAVVGFGYAAMPHDNPFILLALTKDRIEQFMPISMQFNALDVDDNEALLQSIARINEITEKDAIIVGAKHWRGFMQLHLADDRDYKFSQDPASLSVDYASLGKNVYLIEPAQDTPTFELRKIEVSGRR
jgi:hypothetical protein